MAKITPSKFLLLSFLSLSSLGLAKDRKEPLRVDIGYFKFPLNDPALVERVEHVQGNVTAWDETFDLVLTYWDERDDLLPADEEENAIRTFANDSKMVTKDIDRLVENAKKKYEEVLVRVNNDAQGLWDTEFTDFSDVFLDEMDKEYPLFQHRRLASFAGVGSGFSCSKEIDDLLDEMSELEKAGMAAATTLMALIPTFLAFGNLFVPRSSEAFATSWLIGLGAALFSLGLPVRSLSCVRRKQALEVATLDQGPVDEISELGKPNPHPAPKLEELQEWTNESLPHKYTEAFARIRTEVRRYQVRWHCWHVPAIVVAAAQGAIFGLAIEPLLKAGGIPRFIFACGDTNWTGLYLSVSAGVNALFRLAMWQLADHEVVKLYHLTDEAKAHLETLKQPDMTTETRLPPLYPPLISGLHTRLGRIIKIFHSSYEPFLEEHPSNALLQPLRDQFDYAKFVLRDPFTVLRSGFTDTNAAPRWRPLVVLIHLSTQGRPQLRTLFTGFVEAALLLALTFFFAAQWGGNLYITIIALALLLVFITVGRALAIVYVALSARTWGLHTINCDDQSEIRGCMRIICSMQGVLAVVNGAHYYDGHRLDYVPQFRDWRKQYAAGKFDRKPMPTSGTSATAANSDGRGNEKKRTTTVDTKPVGQDMV